MPMECGSPSGAADHVITPCSGACYEDQPQTISVKDLIDTLS